MGRASTNEDFLFALAKATGDTLLRIASHHLSIQMRIGLFTIRAELLTLYGTSLNLAPVEFAAVTELYGPFSTL